MKSIIDFNQNVFLFIIVQMEYALIRISFLQPFLNQQEQRRRSCSFFNDNFFNYSLKEALLGVFLPIFGAALGNFINLAQKKDPQTKTSVLEVEQYYLNFLISILQYLLFFSCKKFYKTALKEWNNENQRKLTKNQIEIPIIDNLSEKKQVSIQSTSLKENLDSIVTICVIVITVLLGFFLRGSSNFKSIIGISYCGFFYWMITLGLVVILYYYFDYIFDRFQKEVLKPLKKNAQEIHFKLVIQWILFRRWYDFDTNVFENGIRNYLKYRNIIQYFNQFILSCSISNYSRLYGYALSNLFVYNDCYRMLFLQFFYIYQFKNKRQIIIDYVGISWIYHFSNGQYGSIILLDMVSIWLLNIGNICILKYMLYIQLFLQQNKLQSILNLILNILIQTFNLYTDPYQIVRQYKLLNHQISIKSNSKHIKKCIIKFYDVFFQSKLSYKIFYQLQFQINLAVSKLIQIKQNVFLLFWMLQDICFK
ncbi:unnamed protein product [Paramecium primaurelia]|uniref:Uncharacterized protein n=1 Tax=Paramecium primaurelia TaxID=5886 RepID=A0A8S1MXZ8_PARPR|nr:unnamed protein product [Paramecium primaurelia]